MLEMSYCIVRSYNFACGRSSRVALRFQLAVIFILLGCLIGIADDRPNILFIMSDDHAAHAIGAYGGRLSPLDPTPTLDRLAREGVRLTNCFCTNAICTPSRAVLMTGQYSHINGVRTLNGAIAEPQQHLARLMKQAGYETAMIGKWHLEAEPSAFDFYTVLPGQGQYFNPVFLTRGPKPWPQNEFRFQKLDAVHSTDAVTDLSIKWLGDRQDKSKPFFLMHHFKAPHDNFENAERYDWHYGDVQIPEPASLWDRGSHGPKGQPLFGTSVGKRNTRRNMGQHMFVDGTLTELDYKREAYQRYLKKYLRCVRGIDDNIARLLLHLEQAGQLDNTVIFYTSDQGFMLGEHDYIDKRWMYEETIRMPFIVRYPKSIEANTTMDSMINNVDFAPTLLSFAGASKPDFMQGESFRELLEGAPEPATWKQATYYRYWMHMAHHDNPAHVGIRTKEFKLIHFYGQPLDAEGALPELTQPYWEFYDLRNDPDEMNNAIDDPAFQSTIASLEEQLASEAKRVGDKLPQ
jgi:arylsulfatase A-like enzyme